jgi:hypothetical protein
VGYSTHEPPAQLDAVKMAIAKGATLFEKHVGVPTEKHPLNGYSATPSQVRQWLEAARSAIAMAGVEGGGTTFRRPSGRRSASSSRGAFARGPIAAGSVIEGNDVFFALPAAAGQLVANDISKYTQYRAMRPYAPNEAIWHAGSRRPTRAASSTAIVRDVKALLKVSHAVVPTQLELEISHHHGLENFRTVGSAMITVINREYCKRLVIMLPGQRHPEHWHTQKDETFHLLHGEIDLVLGGRAPQVREE